jgi:hypothetical protein
VNESSVAFDNLPKFRGEDAWDMDDANTIHWSSLIASIEKGVFPHRLNANTDPSNGFTYVQGESMTINKLLSVRFRINKLSQNQTMEDNFRIVCEYYVDVLTTCIQRRRKFMKMIPLPMVFPSWDEWFTGGYDSGALKEDIAHLERLEIPSALMNRSAVTDQEYININNMSYDWLVKQKDLMLIAANDSGVTRNFRRFASYYLTIIAHYWECKEKEKR